MATSVPRPLDDVRRMIDEPGLTALGHEVQIELTVDGGRVLVTLRHPLRRNSDWGWAPLDLRPASLEQLAAKVAEWPDAHVASAARAVRPEVVPVLSALRHAEVMALLKHGHRHFQAGYNAAVAAITDLALFLNDAAGILNDEEVEWLLKTFESDRQELSAHLSTDGRKLPGDQEAGSDLGRVRQCSKVPSPASEVVWAALSGPETDLRPRARDGGTPYRAQAWTARPEGDGMGRPLERGRQYNGHTTRVRSRSGLKATGPVTEVPREPGHPHGWSSRR